jgi:hypothetical protein
VKAARALAFRGKIPRFAVVAVALMQFFACGGSPIAPPPPPPPPANNVPVITAITVHGNRPNQPANFADISETVTVKADVRDDETPAAQLQYLWSSSSGSFTGNGASVTWQAPAQSQTPSDITLRLEVVERYGPANAPTSLEHRVSANAAVRLHDSIKEVGDMARQFLLDFADPNVRDVAQVMRNFEPGCYGTAEETEQVRLQRERFRMVSSSVGPAAVTVNFGGVCPFRARPGDACAQIKVVFDSIDTVTGARDPPARGTDQVAAVYVASRKEWRLCDSQLDGSVPLHMRSLFR